MSTQSLKRESELQRQVEFWLELDAQSYLSYYRGQIKNIQVTSFCQQRVKFPASLLKPFITHAGVKGRFVLTYLTSGKVVSLTKINQ